MQRFSNDHLIDFIGRALTASGVPSADATIIAGHMAQADMRGVDSHGIFRMPGYIARIRAGGFNVTPDIKTIRDNGGTALIDGDNGIGHLVMDRATRLAIDKAREYGVSWVGTRYSNHAGAAALWATMALEHDMIGIYVAVGSANHLPPWGGTAMLLSTNPIAVAVPTHDAPPVVLDMATTVSSMGKIKVAAERGEMIPEGQMIARDGSPLTDPRRANEGFLLPIGGYKGYGLSLIFGILAGTLNGAAFGEDVVDMSGDAKTPTNTGQFICVVDIARFGSVDDFKTQMDDVVRQMKASPTLDGFGEVRLPGESAHVKLLDHTANGVALPDTLVAKLNEVAATIGIDAFS